MLCFVSKPGRALFGVGAMLLFCSCSHCPPLSTLPPDVETERSAGVFELDPRKPWKVTDYDLQAGAVYEFTAVAAPDDQGRPYSDASIACTPDGPVGFRGRRFDWTFRNPCCPFNPVTWFGPGAIKRLRVLHDQNGTRASFLTVIGAVGTNDAAENVFVIGSHAVIRARDSGRLVLFANDWPGGPGKCGEARFENSVTYANNHGRVQVTVKRQP